MLLANDPIMFERLIWFYRHLKLKYPSTSNSLLEFLEEDFEVAVPLMYRMSDHFLADYVFHLKSQLDKDYIDLHDVNALSRFIIFFAFGLQIIIFLTIQLFELREEEDVAD